MASEDSPQGSALYNIDITYHIMRHCLSRAEGEYQDNDTMQTLARCARTCNSLSKPAMTLLWRYLPSLKPLLSILSVYQAIPPTQVMTSSIAQRDLNGLLLVIYPPETANDLFITLVLCGPLTSGASHPSDRHYHPRRDIRPRVHASSAVSPLSHDGVRVCVQSALGAIAVIHTLGGPQFTTDPELKVAAERVASKILTLSSTLEKLEIPRCKTTLLLSSFGDFKRLRTLDISGTPYILEWTVLQTIGSLRHLTQVALPSAVAGYQPTDQCQGFQALTHLMVGHRNQGTDLLRLISPPRLRSLELTGGLYIEDYWSSNETRDCIGTCLSSCTATFDTFIIDDSHFAIAEPILATAEPFFAMKGLRKFRCSQTKPVGDDDLRAMGAAWPHLEELHLHWQWSNARSLEDPNAVTAPSLQGIAELAHACPTLLRIDLSYAHLSLASDIDPYPDLNHGMEELSLSDVEIEEPVRLARTIDRLFPHLKLAGYRMTEDRQDVSALLGELENARLVRLASGTLTL
ncbi:uncharacterized protein B0H18DRAFT_998363 [Fomitopsis serialis]|uniref:uncharacterized protein n=1 Tax=Fomitopsis serialis TaxID=139415 RepID=UPI0020081F4E|nr:uncharacterized protein B0H18DRAFT_998363 [Neoantrodia serialis]KAH9929232.1 hypothetical protein B0H18DRAFT_998363 [Neoantrodia serialis]